MRPTPFRKSSHYGRLTHGLDERISRTVECKDRHEAGNLLRLHEILLSEGIRDFVQSFTAETVRKLRGIADMPSAKRGRPAGRVPKKGDAKNAAKLTPNAAVELSLEVRRLKDEGWSDRFIQRCLADRFDISEDRVRIETRKLRKNLDTKID